MSLEIKQKLIEMRAKGYSYDKIAKELGKAKQTLIDWAKELEEEISNLRAVELESLYENYSLLKENRLRSLGTLLNKLQEELESRDLSVVPTDKLLNMYLKTLEAVYKELLELKFMSSTEVEDEREIKTGLFDTPEIYEPLVIGEALPDEQIRELREAQSSINLLSSKN